MPRDVSGNYTLPAGNPVVNATFITPTWGNGTMSDIALQLNNVITRDGLLGPTGPIAFQPGAVGAPGITLAGSATSGIYSTGTNKLAFATAGTKRIEIDDIGTTAFTTAAATAVMSVVGTGNQLTQVLSATNADVGNAAGAFIRISADAGTSALAVYSAAHATHPSKVRLTANAAYSLHLGTTAGDAVSIDTAGGIILRSASGLIENYSSQVNVKRFSTDVQPQYFNLMKSRGSSSIPSTVANGDVLGQIQFFGRDSTDDRNAATIRAIVTSVPATSTVSAKLSFDTTPPGVAQIPIARMEIAADGKVSLQQTLCVGGTAGSTYTFEVLGTSNFTSGMLASSIDTGLLAASASALAVGTQSAFSLNLQTNGANNRLVINSAGAVSVAAPTAGTAFIATALAGERAAMFVGAFGSLVTTVASLPTGAAALAGNRAFVSDATATTFASIVAGGGANNVPVYSDGTNWRIG